MPHTTWIEDGLPAYEGESYIGFDHHPNSPLINSIDSISQKLTCPLVANRRNSFSIAIYTMAEKNIIGSFGHGVLRLYGSNVSCDTQQLLWESPVTTNQWQLFLANFTPDSSWRYITLKPWSIDGGDDLIGIDAMSDISVEDYNFLDLDTLQMPADSNCYALKANSDMGGVNYSWHSEPAAVYCG